MRSTAFYVIGYDIPDDRRRYKVARFLEQVGTRVQYSVFEAYLGPATLEKLRSKLEGVLEIELDQVRFYRLCEPCRQAVQGLGQGAVSSPPGVMIV